MMRSGVFTAGVMRVVGLPGAAFLPMVMGFGCTVPALLATRSLESRRDRILAGLLVPFMSCGARLPVFVLMAAVFFSSQQGTVVFALYLAGIVVAVAVGAILSRTLLTAPARPRFDSGAAPAAPPPAAPGGDAGGAADRGVRQERRHGDPGRQHGRLAAARHPGAGRGRLRRGRGGGLRLCRGSAAGGAPAAPDGHRHLGAGRGPGRGPGGQGGHRQHPGPGDRGGRGGRRRGRGRVPLRPGGDRLGLPGGHPPRPGGHPRDHRHPHRERGGRGAVDRPAGFGARPVRGEQRGPRRPGRPGLHGLRPALHPLRRHPGDHPQRTGASAGWWSAPWARGRWPGCWRRSCTASGSGLGWAEPGRAGVRRPGPYRLGRPWPTPTPSRSKKPPRARGWAPGKRAPSRWRPRRGPATNSTTPTSPPPARWRWAAPRPRRWRRR